MDSNDITDIELNKCSKGVDEEIHYSNKCSPIMQTRIFTRGGGSICSVLVFFSELSLWKIWCKWMLETVWTIYNTTSNRRSRYPQRWCRVLLRWEYWDRQQTTKDLHLSMSMFLQVFITYSSFQTIESMWSFWEVNGNKEMLTIWYFLTKFVCR